ncbi:hypothetical protein HMPREF3156_00527 [Neisseria sp. HMSC06F02]|nr:hypothetical protein HMPREF3156_00527 [Neisseria sp. HMSC06F02]
MSHKGFLFGVDGKILTRIEGFYLFAKRYIIKGLKAICSKQVV